MPVQFIFGNTFTAFQLLDAPVNFGVNGTAVGCKPFILLVQYLQGAVNHVVRALVTPERNASVTLFSCWGESCSVMPQR